MELSYSVCRAILIITILTQTSSSLECGHNEHNLNGLRCCKKCPPGRGVVTPCNRENDTICESCRKGEMFSPEASHEDQCQLCTICPQYSHVKRHCDETDDTVCECDFNYYWDGMSKSCHQCEVCPMGFGAKRQCDLHRNTVCSRCPQGTYSDVISDDACKVCSSCEVYQLMLRYCDSMHDTLCVDMPSPPSDAPLIITTISSAATIVTEDVNTQDKLIPVYCGALGLVILLLIIYVIVKQIQYKRNPPNNKKNISYSAVTDPVPAQGGANNNQTTTALQGASAPNNQNQGSDSGVSLEIEARQITNITRIKDLPPIKLKSVENLLHSCLEYRGGWTNFARELGYNNSKIASFESTSSQMGRMPAEILLSEWSKSENANVGVLVKILQIIGREDIINMLYTTELRNINSGNLYSPSGTSNGLPPQHPHNSQAIIQNMDNRGLSAYNLPHVYNNVHSNSHLGVTAPGVVTSQGHINNVGQIGQGQQPVGANSASGSSTTDVSGMYGRPIGFLPSYHSLHGQQMV